MRGMIKFGFIGLFTAPPAKEIEGLGQPPSLKNSNLTRGGGKETSAFEMVLSPLPRNSSGCFEKLWGSEAFWFLTFSKAILGKGAGTISDAEVSRPLPLGRSVNAFGHCLPIPCPPWLGFIAEKPQFISSLILTTPSIRAIITISKNKLRRCLCQTQLN